MTKKKIFLFKVHSDNSRRPIINFDFGLRRLSHVVRAQEIVTYRFFLSRYFIVIFLNLLIVLPFIFAFYVANGCDIISERFSTKETFANKILTA